MKLYSKLSKRIAKKKLGNSWNKLNYFKDFKPGDLISTCIGFNSRVITIDPVWSTYGLTKGKFICDFDVYTTTGLCSVISCCACPTETKREILDFWESFREKIKAEERNQYNNTCFVILEALQDGKEVFNEFGELILEV